MPELDQAAQNRQRAEDAYAALTQHFSREPGLLAEHADPGSAYAYLWPYSQALVASQLLALLGSPATGEVATRLAGLERYWRPQPAPAGYQSTVIPPLGQQSDMFYDDNLWVALALVHQHRATGDGHVLSRARELFRLIEHGWDRNPRHPAPGGVFWVRADWNRDRNTVSTAPAAALALHLYELTGDEAYLDWALRLFSWVERYLRAPNGFYWDHIDLAGEIEPTQWSYNQGTMLGANALLYRVTGRADHLARARELARAALDHYATAGLLAQPTAFNAIFFRNLLLLQALDPSSDFRPNLTTYVAALWSERRDPATGLFRGAPGEPLALLDQAAVVQLHALAALDPAAYALLA